MILNLWSVDQEGPLKIYGGGPRVFWKYSSTLHVFSINNLRFVYTFSLKGFISNGKLFVRADRLIGLPGPL